MVYREKQYNDILCHFNPNHDPRNGRFAESKLGRAIQRHRENRKPSADYLETSRLSKKKAKSLSDAELERIVKRRELTAKYNKKSPAKQAVEAELARFATRAITNAVVATAAVAGAAYLKKKYNISAETVAKKMTDVTGRFASTVAKETASSVVSAVKDITPKATEAAKTVASAAGKKAVDTAASLGEAEIRAAKTVGKKAFDTAASLGEAEIKAVKTGMQFISRVIGKK